MQIIRPSGFKKPAVLPSFFIVGTQKAGTSTLHEWISTQQGVVLPTMKETHFFLKNDDVDVQSYISEFRIEDDAIILGEVDPEYMFWRGASKKINEVCGCSKFVFILRNPIDRAFSHYLMSKRRGVENLNFISALEHENERLAGGDVFSQMHYSYLARGRYVSQIMNTKLECECCEHLYVLYDELFDKDKTYKIFEAILRFVGYRGDIVLPDLDVKVNASSDTKFKWLLRQMNSESTIKRIARILVPYPALRRKLWMLIDSICTTEYSKKSAPRMPKLPQNVIDDFIGEIELLEKFIHRDLTHWKTKLLSYSK